jgi:hypothetical protein
MIDTKYIREIRYENCVIKRMTWGFGVFTPAPINDPSYVWFIDPSDCRTMIPTWTNRFASRIKETGFENCVKLANEYEDFLTTCEWY